MSTSPAPVILAPGIGDVYLIDTMGYIFRAFHALPPLTNSKGLPTAAVLGFANMLRKLIEDARPPALAAAFDLAGPTFRETSFADYKANRTAMPEALSLQLPYIRRVLEAFRVPILELESFEADDVIGTIAVKAAAAGERVIVVSSDKDLLQLVNEQVRVFNPSRGEVLDAARVKAILGVTPAQVADLLALRGDSIDNIPGAEGIGEKGAQMLIERFGSVEEALRRAAEVERKTYRESLQKNRDTILLSRELATIHLNAPIDYSPGSWKLQPPDLEACRALFTELEFHQLLRSITAAQPAASVSSAAVVEAPPPSQSATPESLAQFFRRAQGRPVALAFGGLDLAPQIGLALPDEPPLLLQEGFAEALAAPLADPAGQWSWAESRSLRAQLRRCSLPLPPLAPERVSDIALLAFAVDPTQSSYTLAAIAQRRLGLDLAPADPGQQAHLVARLGGELRPLLAANDLGRVYAELDLPLVAVLEQMEIAGVAVDRAALDALSEDLRRRCGDCEERIFSLAGTRFNLNSPKQLGDVLFVRMGLPAPPRRGKSKSVSTAVDVLEELSGHEVVRHILDYRQFSKLKSTYVDALPPLMDPNGRLHTTFVIPGSATGRLASVNPNLQNIPIRSELGRQIRAAFRATPGHELVAADYSQIELRLLAHFSQDPLLLEAYRTGRDVHALTAAEVFGVPPAEVDDEQRRRAKAVNFGIVYGLSAFGLARQLGIPQAEAARFIQRYFDRYAGVKQFIERTLDEARRQGRVRTLFGRTRPIPNLDVRNTALRGFAERTAINTPLQGTAADLIKLAMIRLQPRLQPLGARLLLQVHDELVLEAPPESRSALAALLRQEMENVHPLTVPLEIEVGAGPNWRDLTPIQ